MLLKHQYLGFLHSESLISNSIFFELPFFKIDPFDFKLPLPEDHEITIPKNEVLGKRIEHFFEFYIKNSYRYELLIKNLQVFKNRITIGELDFLLIDHKENINLHIELIYKFYIYDPKISVNELERWIGPNRKDSLLQKISKLKERQLPLLFKEETKLALSALNITTQSIQQQVCYMANLFVPLSYVKSIAPPINSKCIVGFWIKSTAFTSAKYGSNLFYIPNKQNWIVDPKHCLKWFSFEEIQENLAYLLSQKKSPLVWMKNSEDIYQRFFIVWF